MNDNLRQRRSDASVWDRPRARDGERWLAAAAAGTCLVAALRRRSGAGLALAAAGGVLARWAAGDPEERRGRRTALTSRWRRSARRDEAIDEASRESFPASDPPAPGESRPRT